MAINYYFKISKFFLFAAPLAIAIVSTSTLFPFIVGKYVWFRTSVDLALIFFLLGLWFQPQWLVVGRKLLVSPLAIAVSLFTLIFLLAGFFGVNPSFSFWSNFERGEGGLQMLHLWVFFMLLILLFKEERDWQKIFWVSIWTGVLMILYGVLGSFHIQGFISSGALGERFQGSIGNPSYVAAYLVFLMFYSAYLFSSKYKNKLKSIPSLLLIVINLSFAVFFWLAATRGAFLGLIAAILAILVYLTLTKDKFRKWLIGLGVAIILTMSFMIAYRDTDFVKKLPGSRLFDISIGARTFGDRTTMWKMAWDGFNDRPILGWGPENFISIFDQKFNTNYFKPKEGFGAWFDRAHSIIFDNLAETGILGFLSYLGIFIIFYLQFFRNKASVINNQLSVTSRALIFSLPIAYLVQSLVLFDVLPIYINIFLFMAFAVYQFNVKSQI